MTTSESSEEIFCPYRSEEVELEKKTPFHAMWMIMKLRSWRIFGHHPACSRYKNHYYNIGGLVFCIGCTSIYSAIILYSILFFTVPQVFRFNPYVVMILPFTGFGLAVLHLIFKFKNKWIKTFFRFVAGFGIGAYGAMIILVPKWWVRVTLALLLLLGNQLYGLSRGPNANRKLCIDCPLANAEPPCRPIYVTNVKVRKVYNIIEEELEKSKRKNKQQKNIQAKASVQEENNAI